MGQGYTPSNRYCALLALLILLTAGCGAAGTGQLPVVRDPGQALTDVAAGFALQLLPESFIDRASAEGVALYLAPQARETTATLRISGARGLKAAYMTLAYDAARYTPVDVELGALLGGPELTLGLDYCAQPGVVYIGQVLRDWEAQPGADGEGVLARVRFAHRANRAQRCASIAPNTPRDKAALRWSYATDTLSWYYCNTGDYDQNGQVGLTDLTPLGLRFGQSAPAGGFDEDSVLRQTDGDGNGGIQLGDLAVLGMNWAKSGVGGYNIYRSTNQYDCPTDPKTPPVASTFEAHLALDTAQTGAGGRKQFSWTAPAVYAGHYYWVRPNDKLQDGMASAPLRYDPDGPGDWWMLGHDPQHTFRSNYHGPAAQPHMLWECDLGAAVRSNPVATNKGVMYVTNEDSVLSAVGPGGEVLWSSPLDTKGNLSSTPAIGADGTIFVGSRYYLCALWPNGTWRWYMEVPDCYTASPAISSDGLVLITGEDVLNKLYCFAPSGDLQWDFSAAADNGAGSPAIAPDGSIYATFNRLYQLLQDEFVYCLSPAGEEQWHTILSNQISAFNYLGAPAIGATGSVHLICKNLGNPVGDLSPLFQTFPDGDDTAATIMLPGWPDGALHISGVAIAKSGAAYGRVGFSTGTASELYAIAPNLTVEWSDRLTHPSAQTQTVFTPALDAGGTIYIVENGTLLAYLPDGTVAWSLETGHVFCNSVSILGEGMIVAGFDDGFLRAFGE
jgi:hypothetical protein